MTMLFDQLHVLDTLKSAKVSLTDDIAMARQAYQQTSSSGAQPQGWEEGTDFDGLLEFMEDPWSCVKQVHSCIKQVNYQHRVVARLVQYICDSLLEKVSLEPDWQLQSDFHAQARKQDLQPLQHCILCTLLLCDISCQCGIVTR